MKCVNCKVPAKCLLCGDCWRVAILAPTVIFLLEHGLRRWWP